MPESPSKLITRITGSPAWILLGLVRIYQRIISPVLPAVFGPACGCRFAPTCSHYAAEALGTHGAMQGGWLVLKRLAKCTPLHPGGIDPVPPLPRTKRPICTNINSASSAPQSLFHG